MLLPSELITQLNMGSQITTHIPGSRESADVTLAFEDDRMLIVTGDYDYVSEIDSAKVAIQAAALLLQWASRKERLENSCPCDEFGATCIYHQNIDRQIIHLSEEGM